MKGALLRNLCDSSNRVEACRMDCYSALSMVIRGAGLSDAQVAPQIWRLNMRWEPGVETPTHTATQYQRGQSSYLALENDLFFRMKRSSGEPDLYGHHWPLVQGLSSADEDVIPFERSSYFGDVESLQVSSAGEDVFITERIAYAGDVENLTLSSAREVKSARKLATLVRGATKICIDCHSGHLRSDDCAGWLEHPETSVEDPRWQALYALRRCATVPDRRIDIGPYGTPPLSELRAAANASPIQYLNVQERAARRDYFARRSEDYATCEGVVEANLPLFAAAPSVIQSIGAAICDFFDPTSLEADVLAQHSLVCNGFEGRPVTKLLDNGLPVTLQHFKLVMLQSAAVPAVLFNQIIEGCPFKVDWHASINAPDTELLNRAEAATDISNDIRDQIAALAFSSQNEETQIDIEVSGTYQTIIIKRACTEPSGIQRPHIIKPSPTSLPQQDAAHESKENYEQLSDGFDSLADRESPLSSFEASAQSVASDPATSSSFNSSTSDTSQFYFGWFENKPIRIPRSKSTELLKGLELWIRHLDALLKLENHRVKILLSIGAPNGSTDEPRWISPRKRPEPFKTKAQIVLLRGVQRIKRYKKALVAAKKMQSPSKTQILAELADLWADLEEQAAVEAKLRDLPEMVSSILSSKERHTRTGRCPKTRYSMGYVLPRDLSDEDDDPNFDNLLSSESEATSDSSLELPPQCKSPKARRGSRASLPKRKYEQSESDADADESSTNIQLRPESSAKSRAKRASKRAKVKGDPYESSSLSSLGED
ncbi:hypothetical protein IE81DRAFT_324394 [Ceraceosorus guamensis]|uniref:Uncharacterized protein n=1 Tax=Ceraceosorus guamensis TaxID=1522189 RepID=A0A316W1J7_9BASI|nr:hypothetical protein IE81DRAFT_324394 [Ceraceosorus guamensis]PWN41535.1 hypothetical protein IE81DRAFT_324394 [Ceraceosorus guamensis]